MQLTAEQHRRCWLMLARWLKDYGHMVAEWGEHITGLQYAPDNIALNSFSRENVVLLASADGLQDLYLLRGEGNSVCRLVLSTTTRNEHRFVLEMACMVFTCRDSVMWMDHHEPPSYDPVAIARLLRAICVEHLPQLEVYYRDAFRDYARYISEHPKDEWCTLRNHDGAFNHWEGAYHRCTLSIMMLDAFMNLALSVEDWMAL